MVAQSAAGAYQAVPMVDRLTAVIFAMAARVSVDRVAVPLTLQPTRMAGSVMVDRTVPWWVEHREVDLLMAEPIAVFRGAESIGGRSLDELTGNKNPVHHMTRPEIYAHTDN